MGTIWYYETQVYLHIFMVSQLGKYVEIDMGGLCYDGIHHLSCLGLVHHVLEHLHDTTTSRISHDHQFHKKKRYLLI